MLRCWDGNSLFAAAGKALANNFEKIPEPIIWEKIAVLNESPDALPPQTLSVIVTALKSRLSVIIGSLAREQASIQN